MNLPQTITQSSATIATYTYDAEGTKIRNTGSDGYWDYINGIVYNGSTTTNGAIQFIQTEEGRAVLQAGVWRYEYDHKDHLGNVRISFDKDPISGLARRLQEDEYYAFGLRAGFYNNLNNNRYLYNGKEIQTDLANQYDYGARFYDPIVIRWNTIDPNAESYQEWSPLNYVQNNPIKNLDPDGMGHFDFAGNWIADPTDDETYTFFTSSVTNSGQTFTWMGSNTGWVAETILPSDQLEAMYYKYVNAGMDPFRGAYRQQLMRWAQSWSGFQAGYRKSAKQLNFAEGTAYSAIAIMNLGIAAGETGNNFLIKGVARQAEVAELEALSSMDIKALQALVKSHHEEMDLFFNSEGKTVPSKEGLQAYRELLYRILNNSNGAYQRVTVDMREIYNQRLTWVLNALY